MLLLSKSIYTDIIFSYVCMLCKEISSNPTSVMCVMYFLGALMVAFSRHVSLKSSQDSWDNTSFTLFRNFHHPLVSQYAFCLSEMDAKSNYAKKTYLQIPSPLLFSSPFCFYCGWFHRGIGTTYQRRIAQPVAVTQVSR